MRRIGGASKMNDKSHTPAFRCFKDITTAIVPIIQVIHVSTGVHLDISAQTPHACATSKSNSASVSNSFSRISIVGCLFTVNSNT